MQKPFITIVGDVFMSYAMAYLFSAQGYQVNFVEKKIKNHYDRDEYRMICYLKKNMEENQNITFFKKRHFNTDYFSFIIVVAGRGNDVGMALVQRT